MGGRILKCRKGVDLGIAWLDWVSRMDGLLATVVNSDSCSFIRSCNKFRFWLCVCNRCVVCVNVCDSVFCYLLDPWELHRATSEKLWLKSCIHCVSAIFPGIRGWRQGCVYKDRSPHSWLPFFARFTPLNAHESLAADASDLLLNRWELCTQCSIRARARMIGAPRHTPLVDTQQILTFSEERS